MFSYLDVWDSQREFVFIWVKLLRCEKQKRTLLFNQPLVRPYPHRLCHALRIASSTSGCGSRGRTAGHGVGVFCDVLWHQSTDTIQNAILRFHSGGGEHI